MNWLYLENSKEYVLNYLPRLVAGPRVTMPHISFRDMGQQVELATVAVNERFDTIEPVIYNNGDNFSST